MEWKRGPIHDVTLKAIVKYVDQRGFLAETFRFDEIPEGVRPVMSYVSYTEPGVSRGPHEHVHQTDIFAFLGPGNFLIRLWDNRTNSQSFGKYMEFYGGQDNPIQVIVPPGVVHGYKNISQVERGMVLNYPNQLYMGWGKQEPVDEIRHEDAVDGPFKLED